MKPLICLTDLETTGLLARFHEIIEIGMVLIDSSTLDVRDEFEIKVMPTTIEKAAPAALVVNGYKAENWINAVSLKEALKQYAVKSRMSEAMFCAHNPLFDWSFLDYAFYKSQMKIGFDYHRLDIFSIAFGKLWKQGLQSYKLKNICTFLGIPPEPEPHRAINGARAEYQVFKKLMEMA